MNKSTENKRKEH